MSYAIQYDAEAGLIAIKITGRIDLSLIRQLGPEVIRIAQEHHCFLVLNDVREATPHLATMELYDLPKIFQEIASESTMQAYQFKRALVVSKDIDDFTFFETVSRNRSQDVTLFRDVDEARKWLLGK